MINNANPGQAEMAPPNEMPPPPPAPAPPPVMAGIPPRKQKLFQVRDQIRRALQTHILQDDGFMQAIDELEIQADELFKRIQQGDEAAKIEYLRLFQVFDTPYSAFRRQYILPLISQKNIVEEAINTHNDRLMNALAPLTSRLKRLQQKRDVYLQQKKQFNNIPYLSNKIQHCLDNEILTEIQEIMNAVTTTGETFTEQLNQSNNNLRMLSEQLKGLNHQSLVLAARAACFPALKKEKAEAEQVAAPHKVIDIAAWAEKGLLMGFFLDNLKKFALLKGEVIEEYSDQRIFGLYNSLSKQAHFDEKLILAIAAGFIDRPQNSFCSGHLSAITFLRGSQQFQGCEAALDFLLHQVYEQFPNLKGNNPVGENYMVNALEQIHNVMAVVEHNGPEQNGAAFAAGQPRVNPANANLPKLNAAVRPKIENVPPVLVPQEEQRRERLNALEKRNQQAFEAGNQMMVEQGYRPDVPNAQVNQAPQDFDHMAERVQGEIVQIRQQQQMNLAILQGFFNEFAQLEAFIFGNNPIEDENALDPKRVEKLANAVTQLQEGKKQALEEKQRAEQRARAAEREKQYAQQRAREAERGQQASERRSNTLLMAKNAAEARLKEAQNANVTPQSILKTKGIQGLNEAIARYKELNPGKTPSQEVVKSWFSASELSNRGVQQALKTLPRR